MGFVEGRVIWEPHMPAADPHERAAVYDAMNSTLARLHSFDPAVLRLASASVAARITSLARSNAGRNQYQA